MKHFATLPLAVLVAGLGMQACSSDDPASNGTAGAGGASSGGAGGGTAGSSGSGLSSGGAGGTTTGMMGGSGGNGGATGGSAGNASSGGSAGSGGSGGSGGTGGSTNTDGGANPDGGMGTDGGSAVVVDCSPQMYTPAATPGAACATMMVPSTKLIAAFDAAGVAAGWGVYPNVDGMTGFMPTTATPSAGGANGTPMALSFTVTNLTQGIKIQVGFGMQCQDVRTFQGLSFWAKGTIDAATAPYAVAANTLVIQLGSEKSLLGGCMGATCSAAPPDRRVAITTNWQEYRIPFGCFGNGMVFDGYFTNILFNAFGTNSSFAIDQVGYY